MKQIPANFKAYKGILFRVIVYYKSEYAIYSVPAFLCTPKNLSRLCVEFGAIMCTCPAKYGCRQFVYVS